MELKPKTKKAVEVYRNADVVYKHFVNDYYLCKKNKEKILKNINIIQPKVFLQNSDKKIALFNFNDDLMQYNFKLPYEKTIKFPNDFDAPEVDEGIYDIDKINEYIEEIRSNYNDTDMIIKGNLMVFEKHGDIYISTDHYVAKGE